MAGFMKTVLISAECLACHFSKEMQSGSFSQSITSSLSSHNLLTHLSCVLLAASHYRAYTALSAKTVRQRKRQVFQPKMSLYDDPPISLGYGFWGSTQPWVGPCWLEYPFLGF